MTDEEKKQRNRELARIRNHKRDEENRRMLMENLKKGKYRKGKGISRYENELR